jgi:hypothetical protein
MPKIKNISGLGEVTVPALGITVKPGATVEVSEEAAASLLEQVTNWAPADQAAVKVAPTNEAAPDAPAAPTI